MVYEFLHALFPYLIALYLLDCILFTHKGACVFTSLWGIKHTIKLNGIYLSGLLPCSKIYLSSNIPFVLTRIGIFVVPFDKLRNEGLYEYNDFICVKYKNIDQFEKDGLKIKYNKTILIKGASSQHTQYLLNIVKEIAKLKPDKRINKIKSLLKDSYDSRKISVLNNQYRHDLLLLTIQSSFLFFLLFIFMPIYLYSNLYLYMKGWILIIYIFIAYFLIFQSVILQNKKFQLQINKLKTKDMLSLILSPVNAIHANSYLTKNMYISFDAIALSSFFLSSNDFIAFSRREFYLISELKTKNGDHGWNEFWDIKYNTFMNFIKSKDIDLGWLVDAPDKKDCNAEMYCPVCLAEYSTKANKCSDCDIELKSF